MQINNEFNFEGVEQTMLFPLWGRAKETQKENGIIKDFKSLELAKKMNIDFTGYEIEQHPITFMAWVSRAFTVDYEIKELLKKYNSITVINIGCGFDTAYFRINDSRLKWFDIDLQNVINAKRKLIPEEDNYKMIAGSVLDENIYDSIKPDGKVIVVAVGLLYYFTEEEVKSIFRIISNHFKEVTLFIEYVSPKGVDVANKRVLKNLRGIKMIWGINNKNELFSLCNRVTKVTGYPIFKKIRGLLNGRAKLAALITDWLKIMSFAIIEINVK